MLPCVDRSALDMRKVGDNVAEEEIAKGGPMVGQKGELFAIVFLYHGYVSKWTMITNEYDEPSTWVHFDHLIETCWQSLRPK